jgi:hypothetical protein
MIPLTPYLPIVCLSLLSIACGDKSAEREGPADSTAASAPRETGNGTPARQASNLVEGKDYLVLERVRILDQMGFDQPVEAMSVLAPKGWRTESGVRWRGAGECRGDIITWHLKSTSPDGAIQFVVIPTRTFVASQNQMTRQALMAASQQGGCAVSPPFNASQYVDNLARNELGAASVSDVKEDESLRGLLEKLSAQSNAQSQQYGTNMKQSGSAVYGTLTWADGSKGLVNVGVSVMETPGVDLYGAPSGFATTSVFHQVYIKYPADREAEALKIFGTFMTSHRMNPVWTQAKESFLTRLGNVEHAGRMERLRLMGEQSAAYAKAQSEASDARMRDWERSQASSDRSQSRFIQTIREVESWKDASGSPVELNAGYTFGWSRPDGSIILTNNSLFDPAVEFQQNWGRMEKVKH